MYGGLKFSHVVDKHNPNMNSFFQENYYASKEGIDLLEQNIKLAITIEDTYGVKQQKNDPRYVKWLAWFEGIFEGKVFRRLKTLHKCTDEDYDSFYPVE